ncbi:MAG TPA: hypothetical protein VFA37_06995 [Gaiellaceae bacterium]|nr:hypothetical protein [Gaiellaceae bacterium]
MKDLTGAIVFGAITFAVAGCGGSHGVSSPAMPGTVPSTGAETAIARVQASKLGRGFGFFPSAPTSGGGCLIPGPGISRGIKGTCQTRVSFAGDISVRPAVVTFTESWSSAKFRLGGSRDRTLHHSWRFKVLAGGRVVFIGDHGYFPPQSAE